MDWEIYVRLIEELKQAGYDGWLAFHNYNEPLLNPRLPQELEFVEKNLSKALVAVFSNGDHLNEDLYAELKHKRVKELRITRYPKESKKLEKETHRIRNWIASKPFFADLIWSHDENNRRGFVLAADDGSMKIIAISPAVEHYYDRGGILSDLSSSVRKEPCNMTSHSLSVDFRGRLKMCCNIVPDHEDHQPFVFGEVAKDTSILEVWNSDIFRDLRRRHLEVDWSKSPPCESCTQLI